MLQGFYGHAVASMPMAMAQQGRADSLCLLPMSTMTVQLLQLWSV